MFLWIYTFKVENHTTHFCFSVLTFLQGNVFFWLICFLTAGVIFPWSIHHLNTNVAFLTYNYFQYLILPASFCPVVKRYFFSPQHNITNSTKKKGFWEGWDITLYKEHLIRTHIWDWEKKKHYFWSEVSPIYDVSKETSAVCISQFFKAICPHCGI